MRDWQLKPSDPLYLTIASDARFTPTDYVNDHIWELSLSDGEPSGIAIQTNFGLRARSFRMLPMFSENDSAILDPSAFNNPPIIQEFYANFLSTRFSPFKEIDVQIEYWIPHSHGILINIKCSNRSKENRKIKLEWIVQLSPNQGRIMTPVEIDNTFALTGETSGLIPVVLISGGGQALSSPYPSFKQMINLVPDETKTIMISLSSFDDMRDSFTAARHYLGRSWAAEIHRIRMLNAGLIEIFTGNPNWDAIFAFSQTMMHKLRMDGKGQLPYDSFVLSREPDQGYSLRGDGLDYNYLWNGQPVLESYYLTTASLPESIGFAKSLIRNYLMTQAKAGDIDWKPGISGQRSQLLATPLLSTLAWRIYQTSSDVNFLEEVFTPLHKFLKSWFNHEHDRDQDGIPEWDHIVQAGCEDHPVFSCNLPHSQGVDISTAESPALASFLYRECQSQKEIGDVLHRHEYDRELDEISGRLAEFVESTWDAEENTYLYRDRESHISTQGELLIESSSSGEHNFQRKFKTPTRISIHIQTFDEKTRRIQLHIFGTGVSGNLCEEHFEASRIRWHQGKGFLTSRYIYDRINSIDIQGLQAEDTVKIFTINYHFHDLTSFLPLWAGIPSPERAQAMINNCLLLPQMYNHPYGLPQFITHSNQEKDNPYQNIHLIWLQLIGEGMLRYGYRNEVAQLFQNFMPSIEQSLKLDHAFHMHYNSISGKGNGEKNVLSGVAPISLFLDTIGLHLLSSSKMVIQGFTPFSWPITVKYRGMSIYKQAEKTTVIFPNGETTVIEDAAPKIVSLELGG